MSESQHLIKMVGDIARFFESEKDTEAAVSGIVKHIEMFWDPRMRRKVVEKFSAFEEDVSPIARAAIERLAKKQSFV